MLTLVSETTKKRKKIMKLLTSFNAHNMNWTLAALYKWFRECRQMEINLCGFKYEKQ